MSDESLSEGFSEAAEGPDTAPENDAEAKAREMGWKPKEEWEGDTSNWMPAEDFIERNERLKNRGDEILKADNAKLTAELQELKRTVGDLKDHLTKADKRAYDRAIKDLKSRQRQAVEDGDTQAFEQVEREMQDLTKQAEEATPQQQQDQPHPDFPAWHAENPWYGTDPLMSARAEEIAERLSKRGDLQGREFFDAVTEQIKREYPDKFETKRKASSVEGASGTNGGGDGSKWSKVDKEGREAFKRFVKQGVFEDTKADREQYAADYLTE